MQTINYLPSILQEIKEFKVITDCDDFENNILNVSINDLYNDQFITTTEKSIKRYETMLGIVSKGADTLEDRRFRIVAVYNKQLPYTTFILKRNLTTLCGQNGFKLKIDYYNNLLTVKIALTAKSMFDTVKNYLDSIIPMNLAIELSLIYNQYKLFNENTYNELLQYTFNQLREEVVT